MVLQSTDVNKSDRAQSEPLKAGMRIACNCRSFMNRHYTGIGRYGSRLIHALKKIDRQNRYILYAPKALFSRKRVVPNITGPNISVRVDRFKRGLKNTVGDVDIYHALSPEIFDIEGCKSVVTIHDLVYKAYPQGHTDETLRLTEEQFQFFIPRASRFICCSENTAADLMKYFHVPQDKIRVVYPGIDLDVFYHFDDQEKIKAEGLLRSMGIERPYILNIGTLEPRKNLNNLIRAFAILKQQKQYDGKLVVCGMSGWMSDDLSGIIEGAGLKDQIKLTGFLPDEALSALYNLADCFAFVSLYEGFGYPIVEALSCGAPTLASNTGSMQEVASDAALCADPKEPQKIAEGLKRLIKDTDLRNDLFSKGMKRAKEFSHFICAQKTLEIYREAHED